MFEISTVDFRNEVADTINRVAYGNERALISRRGKPLVALVSIEDLEKLKNLDNN